MEKYIQVIMTTGKRSNADKIALALVEKKLAACVQVMGPIESTYRWEGEIEQSQEWLCLIKSRQSLFTRLENEISKLHPYETPEIIAVPITAGSGRYLAWIEENTRQAGD